ncbi:MAG: aspartate-semialdehyde dehydrogenase [Candidatus Omnitrophica bacterium]|nr:aspartate-semialdehyde dehydrogenase [Candidatus Omnitrophota bacterium]
MKIKKKQRYNVAVIGVGVVGIEMLRVLKERNFPVAELRVFARSGREIEIDGEKYSVQPISPTGFEDIDIALFAGTEGEKGAAVTYASEAIKRGAVVIDNGADFRLNPKVPLVVPEVNAKDVREHQGIIANPNCSTIQLVVVLWPIYKEVGVKRVIITTLQAASGAGKQAVEQLNQEIGLIVARGFKDLRINIENRVMPNQLGYNVFPHIGSFDKYDYTTEEWKLVYETQKIMHDNKIKISATTVRVAVKTGHCESVYIETEEYLPLKKLRRILAKSPSIILVDEPKKNIYPTPLEVEGKNEVLIGRIRRDPFFKRGIWLWSVADNLRKGAATNAVQIAELLI